MGTKTALLPLVWHNEKRKVKDLVPYEFNPRKLSEEKKQLLINSIEKYNLAEVPAINTDNVIIAGHQRIKVLMEIGRGEEEIDVRVPNRLLTEVEFKEYNITSNIPVGFWDVDVLEEHFKDVNLEELGLIMGGVTVPDDDESEEIEGNFDDPGIESKSQYGVIVTCDNEGTQESVFRDLTGMGFNCKIVVT